MPVREFSGKIIGWIEEDDKGNQQARSFSGKILGTYNKELNVTRAFSGKIITNSNSLMGLIYKEVDIK